MKLTISPIQDIHPRSAKNGLYLALLAGLQLLAAILFTLSIPADPENAVFLGFSTLRLFLVFATLTLIGGILWTGISSYQQRPWFQSLARSLQQKPARQIFSALLFLLILWGWLSIFLPSYRLGRWIYHFERLQPFSIAIGLSALEYWLLALMSQNHTCFRDVFAIARKRYLVPSFVFSTVLLGVAGFIAISKIGLVQQTDFWNVPGIPLSGLQFFSIILFIVLAALAFSRLPYRFALLKLVQSPALLPIVLFVVTVLVWGLTPMLKDAVSLQPTAPHYQPYPIQDTRVHDIGAIAVVKGEGILFHGYTDKPLYMVFLSVMHLIAGYDYHQIAWLHILLLAWIPPVLFWFGKRYHSAAFGLLLALIILIRQRNAIELSYKIASANPKVLLTEVPTLLGIILFSYVVFLWFQTKKPWLALLSGGVIGAVSLVRLNPLLLFPAVACLIPIVFWKSLKNIFLHLALYTLGLAILIGPWFVSGVNPDGQPWIILKFLDVLNVRYNQTIDPQDTLFDMTERWPATGSQALGSSIAPAAFQTGTGLRSAGTTLQGQALLPSQSTLSDRWSITVRDSFQSGFFSSENIYLILNHWLHNFSTSLLSMPDSLVYDDLNHLSRREYWQDFNTWPGDLPASQIGLIAANLVLIGVGLGYSWKRHRWAGLSPLLIFLAYAAAAAFGMNSGSRYIVPIDWILYFYYALAIVLVIRFVLRSLNVEGNGFIAPSLDAPASPGAERKAFWRSLVGLALLASFIPIANILVPALKPPQPAPIDVSAVQALIPTDPSRGEMLMVGEILYPYYWENGDIYFTLLSNKQTFDFMLDKRETFSQNLFSGDWAILKVRQEQENLEVDAIFRVQDGINLIWSRTP